MKSVEGEVAVTVQVPQPPTCYHADVPDAVGKALSPMDPDTASSRSRMHEQVPTAADPTGEDVV